MSKARNLANATSNNTASAVVARDASGNFTAGTITATATQANQLTTARTLWGQSFNGSADISGNLTGVGSITATGALGLAATGANDIVLTTNSAERIRITAAGNVGINTNDPEARLHVVGTVRAQGSITVGSATGDNSVAFGVTTTACFVTTAGTPFQVRISGVGTAVFKTAGQVRLVPLADNPSGAENGDLYYNSTTNKFRGYENGAWSDLVIGQRLASVTCAATTALNFASADIVRVTLDQNTTFTFSGAADGQKIIVELTQDGNGNRTVQWPSSVAYPTQITNITLSTVGGKRDRVGFIYNSAANKYDLVAVTTGY